MKVKYISCLSMLLIRVKLPSHYDLIKKTYTYDNLKMT